MRKIHTLALLALATAFTAVACHHKSASDSKASEPIPLDAVADGNGALPGKFSVSDTKQIQFSKGNLYWNGSAFKFEDNQYDFPVSWDESHVSLFFWSNNASAAYSSNYIDFCARNGIQYHSVTGIIDENHREYPWYYNVGSSTGNPNGTDDTSRLNPLFDIESISGYAAEKGVQIRVHTHWKILANSRGRTLSTMSSTSGTSTSLLSSDLW